MSQREKDRRGGDEGRTEEGQRTLEGLEKKRLCGAANSLKADPIRTKCVFDSFFQLKAVSPLLQENND